MYLHYPPPFWVFWNCFLLLPNFLKIREEVSEKERWRWSNKEDLLGQDNLMKAVGTAQVVDLHSPRPSRELPKVFVKLLALGKKKKYFHLFRVRFIQILPKSSQENLQNMSCFLPPGRDIWRLQLQFWLEKPCQAAALLTSFPQSKQAVWPAFHLYGCQSRKNCVQYLCKQGPSISLDQTPSWTFNSHYF